MDQLMSILNSPFVLLVAGAAISGLLVQWIVARWQHRYWVIQQTFTARATTFEKELSQKYKVLEEINEAVARILSHCQLVAVGYQKKVSSEQQKDQITRYNAAVMQWDVDFRTLGIRLESFFQDAKMADLWNAIKKQRDALDVKLYLLLSKNQGSPDDCYQQIVKISDQTVELSRRMLADMSGV